MLKLQPELDSMCPVHTHTTLAATMQAARLPSGATWGSVSYSRALRHVGGGDRLAVNGQLA